MAHSFLLFRVIVCFLTGLCLPVFGCDLRDSKRSFFDESGISWKCRDFCPTIRGCQAQCCATMKNVTQRGGVNGTMAPRFSPGSEKKSVWHHGIVTRRSLPVSQSSQGSKKTSIWRNDPVTPRSSPGPQKMSIWRNDPVTSRSSPELKKELTWPNGHENVDKVNKNRKRKPVWYLMVAIFLYFGCLLVIGGKETWDTFKNKTRNFTKDVEAQREDAANKCRYAAPLVEDIASLASEQIAQATENDQSSCFLETSI